MSLRLRCATLGLRAYRQEVLRGTFQASRRQVKATAPRAR
jgi:hypothetical protein